MKKYWILFKLSWQNGFVYRTSLLMWRAGELLQTLMSLSVWSVIFQNQDKVLSYSQDQMVSYIFLISILRSVIVATSLNGLARTIYSGNLSYELLKPVNLFAYFATEDVADKIKNFLFMLFEFGILILLFKPMLIFPSTLSIGLFAVSVLLGICLNFFITVLFGTIGFWSPHSWAPKFLFMIIVSTTSGRLFPLDIMPTIIQKVLFFTPFPYLSFVQTQIFLEKIPFENIFGHFAALLGWTIGSWIVVKIIWKNGIKNYTASGR